MNERPLSPAHLRVADCLLRGLANKQIAAELHMALSTVECHTQEMRARVGARSLRGLIVWLARNGVAKPPLIYGTPAFDRASRAGLVSNVLVIREQA